MVSFINAPVTVAVTRPAVANLTMPDILICNQAMLNYSKMKSENVSVELAEYLFEQTGRTYEPNAMGRSRFQITIRNASNVAKIDKEALAFLASRNLTGYEQFYDYFRILPETFIGGINRPDPVGILMSDFYENATQIHHYLFGVCYVSPSSALITWPGMYDGASLYLFSSPNTSASGYNVGDGFLASYERGFALEIQKPIRYASQDFIKVH